MPRRPGTEHGRGAVPEQSNASKEEWGDRDGRLSFAPPRRRLQRVTPDRQVNPASLRDAADQVSRPGSVRRVPAMVALAIGLRWVQ